jgi:hypothetical protein
LITRHVIVVCCFLILASLAPAGPVFAGKDDPEPIVVEEPHYGEILFYFYQEDYFPAIVRLLAAQQQGQLEQHSAQADLLKGGLYLSYGHHLTGPGSSWQKSGASAATSTRRNGPSTTSATNCPKMSGARRRCCRPSC